MQVLNAAAVDFPIVSLKLNKSNKLLAVAGHTQLALVILPRRGTTTTSTTSTSTTGTSTRGKMIDCRSLKIGAFYHSTAGAPQLASVSWHPLASDGASLLALTSDGLMREYAVALDAAEPAQVVSFVSPARHKFTASSASRATNNSPAQLVRRRRPSSSSSPAHRTTAGFGLASDESRAYTAVSLALGADACDAASSSSSSSSAIATDPTATTSSSTPSGWGTWAAHTLFALMQNGDIYAVCPFLPARGASVPALHVHHLAQLTAARVDAATAAAVANSSRKGSDDAEQEEEEAERFELQLHYVNALVRQASAAQHARALLNNNDGDEEVQEEQGREDEARAVVITSPPSSSGMQVARQGPFLLQPAPVELDSTGMDEPDARDLCYVHHCRHSTSDSSEELSALLVAFADGRVDVCLELDKVQARWGGAATEGRADLPALYTYESIDLQLAEAVRERGPSSATVDVEAALEDNVLSFTRDPLYGDTVYVHHAFGAHSLSLGTWLPRLAALLSGSSNGDDAQEEDRLRTEAHRLLAARPRTQVDWLVGTSAPGHDAPPSPVIGLAVVDDIYLGYSLLMSIAGNDRAVAIELALRLSDADESTVKTTATTTAAPSEENKTKAPTEPPAYVSALERPFDVPAILDRASSVSGVPRLALAPASQSASQATRKGEITPDSLRFIGGAVEKYRRELRQLAGAADAVQVRIALQQQEMTRQLKALRDIDDTAEDLRRSTTGGATTAAAASTGQGIGARVARVAAQQERLVQRTDSVLQRLMNAHHPQLSQYETRWFDELRRLEREIGSSTSQGADGHSGSGLSLHARAARLQAQIETLLPTLKKDDAPKSPATLGRKQVAAVESQLSAEYVRAPDNRARAQLTSTHRARLLADAQSKIERITAALAQTSM